MISIGIGGNIGSGKTTVAKELLKYFRKDKLKVKLIDADRIAWSLYRPNFKLYQNIVNTFGKSILDKKGDINRKKLGAVVFNNKTKLAKLNKIVHPLLISNIRQELKKNDADIKILDAALLFFWGKKIPVTYRVLVTSPTKQKVARMKKRGYNPSEVKIRLQQQMKESKMEKSADFVINNDSTLKALKNKVKFLFAIIQES